FANGFLGEWDIGNGTLLADAKLHGAVVHVVLQAGKLHVATELGDYLTMDITVYGMDYCALLREVWSHVPIVWADGLPVVRPAPLEHRCTRSVRPRSE
ncbi:MAG: hypothetical protein V2A73_04345, partial [Pseudomonadota bacterium]